MWFELPNKYFENQILQAINLTSLWVAKNDNLSTNFIEKLLTGPLLLPEFYSINH